MNDRDLQERKVFLAQIEEHFEKKNFRTALELARPGASRRPGGNLPKQGIPAL